MAQVDTSIYSNLLRPPKSVAEYTAEMDAAENAQIGLQVNRQNLIGQQQGLADDKAIRALYQQPDFDPMSQGGVQQLMRVSPKAGYAAQEAYGKHRKGEAELGETRAKTKKTEADTVKTQIDAAGDKMKQYISMLDYVDTPQGYARLLQAQFQDPLLADQMGALGSFEDAVKRIPQDPAQFQQFRQQARMGMENHLKQKLAEATQAETGRHNKTTEAGTIRGQDMSASTARRGQDISASTTIRGQNMTDARSRDANETGRALLNQERQLKVDALQTKADEANRSRSAGISSAGNQISVIDKALEHPGRKTSTGLSGKIDPRNYTPGTDAADFHSVLDQIGGSAFLQAFESLKGGGQITEVEGKKATDAIARLSRRQSDAEFERSLKDLRSVMTTGYKRLSGNEYEAPKPAATSGFDPEKERRYQEWKAKQK